MKPTTRRGLLLASVGTALAQSLRPSKPKKGSTMASNYPPLYTTPNWPGYSPRDSRVLTAEQRNRVLSKTELALVDEVKAIKASAFADGYDLAVATVDDKLETIARVDSTMREKVEWAKGILKDNSPYTPSP